MDTIRAGSARSTGKPAREPVPLRQAVAELLELSDLLDAGLRLRLDAYREGYAEGLKAGYERGYAQAVADWKVTAAGMTWLGGPAYAELDRRRYPPDGRLSWIIPRQGGAGQGAA
jgi:flagellar biosynthesis/type III secretory pathway protein FliH